MHRYAITRFCSICAKLGAMGYAKDITWSEENLHPGRSKGEVPLEYLPSVRQAKPLTERGMWLTSET